VDHPELVETLDAELGVHVTGLKLLADGLNRVVAVTTAESGDPSAYVLRRPTALRESEVFVDLRTEYAVLERLTETPVPAPAPVLYHGDASLLGRPFAVVEHLPGRPFPWGADLPERYRTPATRDRVATLVVETLAEVHAVDTAPFATVCERVTTQEQIERTATRVDAVTDATGHRLAGLRRVADRLRERVPATATTEKALVHGDFRPGNLLFDGDPLAVTGVLDWETAMLGDPLTELGYLLLDWRGGTESWPAPSAVDAPADAAGMDRVHELHREGLSPFTHRPGSPAADELVARYEARSSRSFTDGPFYRALAAFGLATVWADIHRHAVATGAADPVDALPVVEYTALVAEHILEAAAE
jgi:aminoglycoside phosphotransferase (APT) family kinase protein